jgi:hypothetical protein
VREAADYLNMTTGGVYQAVKRGDITAIPKTKPKRLVRATVIAHLENTLEYLAYMERKKTGRLTDDEFIQALWDSDPD